MSNNIGQRSIDQAKKELRRAQDAIEAAQKKLRSPTTVPDAAEDLQEAKQRVVLALRQLQ